MKAEQIIESCMSLARHYADDDPMRHPFIIGVLTGKIRELCHLLELHEGLIKDLQEDIKKIQSEI